MNKIALGVLFALAAALIAGNVASALSPRVPASDKAVEKSPVINSSGQVNPEIVPFTQLPEDQLTKILFVRYAPGKEPVCNNNGTCDSGENWKGCPNDCQKGGGGSDVPDEPAPTACYGFFAGSKPHWNWAENYAVDDAGLIASTGNAVVTWEGATSANIFGSRVAGAGPWGTYDLKNSIVYGDFNEPGVIGVTAVWYQGKKIYEYDIMYDTDFFPGNGSVELDTVVLHEMGHGAGLDDLYDSVCVTEVMYGYYDGSDLNLGPGDTQGIHMLYGI